MTKFGINKENMFEFWDVRYTKPEMAEPHKIMDISYSFFCFTLSSGLEGATPCGLPSVSPLLSPLAWTTLRGCLLEHILW